MRSSHRSSDNESIDLFTTDVARNQQLLGSIPSDALASRRLSQSNVRASTEMSLSERKDLHKWAAEALTARPETNAAPPLDPLSNSTSSLLSNGRRESEGGVSWTSKSSAPPVGGGFSRIYPNETSTSGTSYDTIPRYHTPNHLESVGTKRNSFLSTGLRERPNSMFAMTSPTSDTSFALQIPKVEGTGQHQSESLDTATSHQGSQRHPSLKSCLKTHFPPTEDDNSETPTALHSMLSQSSLGGNGVTAVQKSVHISDDLPRLKEGIQTSSGSSSPVSSSPMASRLVRRNAAHKRNGSEIRPSRRSYGTSYHHSRTHSHNSPTLTDDTTCDSEEEDGVAIVTPMDEDGPDSESSRIKDTGSLRLLTEVKSQDHSDHSTKDEKKDFSGIGPFLSHTTLLEIGREKGLTPPTMQDDTHRSQVANLAGTSSDALSHVVSPTSVVSAGLGMGLGARMGASTLSTSIPQTSSSELSSFIEARFDRFAGQMDLNALAMTGLQLTEAQNDYLSHVKVKSDHAAEEVSFAELDRDDAELNRRRTTGGLQSRREIRPSGVVGKRRVHRTGTQDPHGAHMNEVEEGTASGDSSHFSTTHSSPFVEPQMHGTTSTPLDTPSHGHKALLSPSIEFKAETSSIHSRYEDSKAFPDRIREANKEIHDKFAQPMIGGAYNLDGGLMGIGEVGHFGPGVRAKVSELIEAFIGTIPLLGQEGETVNMMEYGALNSRSGSLLRPAISSLAKRAAVEEENEGGDGKEDVQPNYFQGRTQTSTFQTDDSKITFCVTHEDAPSTDFRAMTQMLETHRDSYLNTHWQAKHSPCLTNAIFPSFAARPFASRLAPPNTMHLGISLMDMHWTHTPNNAQISRATTAQAELTAFLNSRANEFKKDGLLFMAYIARSDDSIRPSLGSERLSSDPMMTDDENSTYSISPIERESYNIAANTQAFRAPKKDIWTTLSNTLAPCIQRLVSCGMLKSDVARHLLDLPMHPRTAKQTRAALKSVEDKWKLEWSCGLGQNQNQNDKEGIAPSLPNEPTPLRLAHPAWKAFESGCLSRVPFAEHMIQLFKNLYECHFRNVLREKGRLSKGAVEFVLDSLWDALFSRIVDSSSSTAKDIEIEVCIYALRRR